ncbi:hypothetical protein PYS60_04030 [Amygdalobacter indicium]|nr:hypothetical protein [Amygdalobacter indicium]WEG33877.1 hypothetical protein PYS60_04030 [Amygdalobacter indicium]
MSQKELTRLHVLKSCLDGNITNERAANRLNISIRRVQQLKRSLQNIGNSAVIHGNVGKPLLGFQLYSFS